MRIKVRGPTCKNRLRPVRTTPSTLTSPADDSEEEYEYVDDDNDDEYEYEDEGEEADEEADEEVRRR